MSDAIAIDDRLALQDVIVRYAACIDERDYETYRTCFDPDVVLEGFGREQIRGVDAWIDFVKRALEAYTATQHMLGPPQASLRDGGPHLRTDLQAQHFLREPEGRIFTLWGTYETDLHERDGAWVIARHELVVRATRTSDAYSGDVK